MGHFDLTPEQQAHTDAMCAFYQREEVRELGQQLWNGLIHPIEYAQQIILYAAQDGLWGN